MEFGLQNKGVIVTGGTRGIGFAIANAFAAEGANIILTARSGDILKKEAADIQDQFGVRVEPIACDLSKENEIDQVIDFALDRFNGIDIQFWYPITTEIF